MPVTPATSRFKAGCGASPGVGDKTEVAGDEEPMRQEGTLQIDAEMLCNADVPGF